MKLLIVLSLIAYGYAAKLDRTYLPPANAATAGGSPGSLTAPGQESSFGQQAPGFRGSQSQPGRGSYNQASGQAAPSQAPGFGQSSRSHSQAGPSQSAFGRPGQSGFGQAGAQPNFGLPSGSGVQPSGLGQTQFGQQGITSGQGQKNQGSFVQPQQPERAQAAADRNAEILRYDSQNDGETFAYSFETSNGIAADESGVATNGVQAQGGYSYTGDDGQFYKITYTADENGYLPQGDHLPTPPPIPDEIQRSIEENARAAAAGTQEGAYNPDEDNSPVQYNQVQGQQQQFRGSNGFAPSGSAGQSQTRPQEPAFQGSNRPGVNQPQGFNQGFTQQASGQVGNQQGPTAQNRPQGQVGGQGQSEAGYDYSRPQGQGRQPSGNANSIHSGTSKAPGSQNQARPFQPSQNKPGPSGSFAPSKSNQGQFQAPEFNQPQRQQTGNQGFRPTGTQFNQGSNQPKQQFGNQGSQFNQKQGLSGSQPSQGPQNFGQMRPSQNSQQPQQMFQGQRGSQGSKGVSQNQDGYEYNRPQSTFNSANQGQFRPQSQGPAGSGSQGFPGSRAQPGFPISSSSNRPGSPQGQSQGAFPGQQQGFSGSSEANRPSAQGPQFPGPRAQSAPQFGQQTQRPGSQQPNNPLANQTFNQKPESFEGPRQQPSFSPEDGYKY